MMRYARICTRSCFRLRMMFTFRMGARMILDVVGDHKGQFYEIGDVG
jgi:hypothetical protein